MSSNHDTTTQTQLPTDTTLVVQFPGLPTHLPPKIKYNELLAGLSAYGSDPILQFVVPIGASHLAGPHAFATIHLSSMEVTLSIPPHTIIPYATDHPFWARMDGGRTVCPTCFKLDTLKWRCPSNTQAMATHPTLCMMTQ